MLKLTYVLFEDIRQFQIKKMSKKNILAVLLSCVAGFCFTVLIYNLDLVFSILEALYENQILIHTAVLFFYFFLFVQLSKKIFLNKKIIYLITVITPLLIDASVLITNHDKIPIRFPFASIFPLIGAYMGDVYINKSKFNFRVLLSIALVFLFITYALIMPKLLWYSINKNSKPIENTILSKIFYTAEEKIPVILKDTCVGKYMLIDFFFSGCPPCEQKRDALYSLRKKFSPNQLGIILICDGTITSHEKFIEYFNKYNTDGIIFLYDKDGVLQKLYNIKNYPFEVLLKAGHIIRTLSGYDEITKDEYYNETVKKINEKNIN
jgi:thiol-disulfide isomerase/thioredoxin